MCKSCAGQHDGSQAPSDGMVWVHIRSSAPTEKGLLGAEEPLLGTCQVSNTLPSDLHIALKHLQPVWGIRVLLILR